jgi:hypothetical protein
MLRNGRVVEAAHPRERPEVVVERTVLLYQDHHVFDIRQFPGRQFFLRQRLLDQGIGPERHHAGSRAGLQ